MSELAAPYIKDKDKDYIKLAGAVGNPTITPRLVYHGGLHAFGLNASQVGGGMGGVFAHFEDFGNTVVPASAYYDTVPTTGSVLAKHDQVTLTDKRFTPLLESFVEWWDAATPGMAGEMNFTGTSGSPVITVPDIGLLTVGQEITSSGNDPIPANTKIVGLFVAPTVNGTPGTHYARLSKALINNAASFGGLATMTGANLVGRVSAAYYRLHGGGLPASIA